MPDNNDQASARVGGKAQGPISFHLRRKSTPEIIEPSVAKMAFDYCFSMQEQEEETSIAKVNPFHVSVHQTQLIFKKQNQPILSLTK